LAELRIGLSTLQQVWKRESQDGTATRPAQVGKYLIVGTLGAAADTAVYRGLHATLNKEVVLVLGRQFAGPNPADRARLINDGKPLALLEHPALARVLDLDFHEGRPFLVAEYIDGVNLEEYAATGHPSPQESAALVAKLARGVAAAHRQRLVHCDIKPRNVVITEAGEPVLIGLGLQWLRKVQGHRDEPPAPATDVFGLGGVLYFLLAGRPFSPGEPDDAPNAPRSLVELCKRALSPGPEDR